MKPQDCKSLNSLYVESVQNYNRSSSVRDTEVNQPIIEEQYEDIKSKIIGEFKKIKNPNKRQVSFNKEKSFLGPYMKIALVGDDLKLYAQGVGFNNSKEIDFDEYFKKLRGGDRLLIQALKKINKQQQRDIND